MAQTPWFSDRNSLAPAEISANVWLELKTRDFSLEQYRILSHNAIAGWSDVHLAHYMGIYSPKAIHTTSQNPDAGTDEKICLFTDLKISTKMKRRWYNFNSIFSDYDERDLTGCTIEAIGRMMTCSMISRLGRESSPQRIVANKIFGGLF